MSCTYNDKYKLCVAGLETLVLSLILWYWKNKYRHDTTPHHTRSSWVGPISVYFQLVSTYIDWHSGKGKKWQNGWITTKPRKWICTTRTNFNHKQICTLNRLCKINKYHTSIGVQILINLDTQLTMTGNFRNNNRLLIGRKNQPQATHRATRDQI